MSLEGSQTPEFTLPSTASESVRLSDRLTDGPAVVLINRGHWCSFCAEQLGAFSAVSYDLWFNDGVDILPVITSPLGKVTEMRDRFKYDFQLLADPEGQVAAEYSETEQTSHGTTGIAATYVVDTDGIIQYEHVSTDLTDRTYGNWVRYFIRNGFTDPF